MNAVNNIDWAVFRVDLSNTNNTILSDAVASLLRRLIADGILVTQTRLPSTRDLAKALAVSPATIAAAYSALAAQGVLHAHVGRGTFVKEGKPAPLSPIGALPATSTTSDAVWLPPRKPSARQEVVGRWLARARPGVGVNLVGGYGDYRLAPAQEYWRALESVAREDRDQAMQFCPPLGHIEARQAVADLARARMDIAASVDDVYIGTSAHSFLDLILRCFLEPGDVVACETATYYGSLDLFALAGIRVVAIPSDEEGIRPDGLANVLHAHRPKLVYLTGTASHPNGRMWSQARRDAIAAVVRRSHVLVVEDGSVAQMRYGAAQAATLKSVDETGQVIFVCSFSRAIFPGLRIAAAIGSPEIGSRLSSTLQSHTRLQASLPQLAFARFIRSDAYTASMREATGIYRARRDALIEGLGAEAAGIAPPECGFTLWLELRDRMDGNALCQRLSDASIFALPGDVFVAFPDRSASVRLAFGQNDADILRETGKRISAEIAALRRSPETAATAYAATA
jgi:DNA-binding transcriptional MocR family regulator